ncbi:MAG TPA: lipid-binding SYLF domain-containing protein [Terriglobia bacterium]|nr:lipid-binding SYLF domain-containing protein [Terriglobia bacterium]
MRSFAILVLAALSASSVALGANESKEAQRLRNATYVVNEVMQTPENGIPRDLLDRAVCVGIVPSEKKGAFILGGSFGRGALVCRRGGTGPWGAPSLFTLYSGSWGFQIGGQATDIVFIVMNTGGMRKLLQSGVKLGADASVAAGPVGRKAEGATDVQLHAEILSYSRSRGLFAGLSLDGGVLRQDEDGNQRLYGKAVTAKDVLIKGDVPAPAAAEPLDRILMKYSPHGGAPFADMSQGK